MKLSEEVRSIGISRGHAQNWVTTEELQETRNDWADRIADLESRPTIACHNALQEEKDGCFAAVKSLESRLEKAQKGLTYDGEQINNLLEMLNEKEGIIASLKGQLER